MIPLNRRLTKQDAETFSLVLSASGIEHRLRNDSGAWEILTLPDRTDLAEAVIQKYLDENASPNDIPQIAFRTLVPSWAGVGMALFLAACHAGTVWMGKETVHESLKASAFAVMQGEYYRCVTALLMHADIKHLLGNMAGMGLFGTWTCQLTGMGVGIGLIVLSGAMGNYLNALFYQYGHSSLGASTAVFSALGILIGIRFLDRIRMSIHRRKAWIQIAAGLSLLAFLGSSARTDLTAHVFGFIAGTATGAVFAVLAQIPPEKRVQFFSLMLTLFIIAVSVYRGFSA